ncbi:hypothetical protein [Sporosarcina sp. HYO08]|uniref:hypothetical protein n=1 Tax=Sporosarcina sp. HYO08 TaxID=1759557 RepID=UPI00079B0406|nr:hypothetical protein [Sporosarcina sp. HYO08]KXH83712.1 hypothetical protein AU377_15085 [Sporosarcina sp. HYO08]
MECYDFHQKEIEEKCKSNSIEYTKAKWGENDFYFKIKAQNIEQFNVVFPYAYANGSMNNFACLSLEKDVFSIGHRVFKRVWGEIKDTETPIITINDNTALLWVSYDGDGAVFISNDNRYSQLSLLTKTFPLNTNYSIWC